MHIFHIHGKKKKKISAAQLFGFSVSFFFFKHLSSVWVPQNEAKGSRVLPSTMDSTQRAPFPLPSARTPKFQPSPDSSLRPPPHHRKLAQNLTIWAQSDNGFKKSTVCGWRGLLAPCRMLTRVPPSWHTICLLPEFASTLSWKQRRSQSLG